MHFSQNDHSPIHAVILDWGGVLIEDPAPGFASYCAHILKCDSDILAKAIAPHMDEWQSGSLSEAEFWLRVCTPYNIALPNLSKGSLWGKALEVVYKPCEEVISSIWSLKKAGIKIGFCSNTEPPSKEFHLSLNYDFIDARVFSCDEHILKPDPQIYKLICKRLDVSPENCLMIDDRSENIQGAVHAGLQGLLFQNGQDYLKQLSKRTEINFMI